MSRRYTAALGRRWYRGSMASQMVREPGRVGIPLGPAASNRCRDQKHLSSTRVTALHGCSRQRAAHSQKRRRADQPCKLACNGAILRSQTARAAHSQQCNGNDIWREATHNGASCILATLHSMAMIIGAILRSQTARAAYSQHGSRAGTLQTNNAQRYWQSLPTCSLHF